MPSNIFYGTGIPATILVFKKCRKDDEDILFIDASKEFENGKNQNKLTDENVAKILETYKNRSEIEKYSHKAKSDEIKENEYNLNIPRYVDTFEEEAEVDIQAVQQEIVTLEAELEVVKKEMDKYLKELTN